MKKMTHFEWIELQHIPIDYGQLFKKTAQMSEHINMYNTKHADIYNRKDINKLE